MSDQPALFEQDARYCIDSNVIANFLSDSDDEPYDVDVFAPQWQLVQRSILNGESIAPRQVEVELLRWRSERLHDWVKHHTFMFQDLSSAQLAEAKRVVNLYPAYGRDQNHLGDLEVISLASARGITVVTSERRDSTRSTQRPKIPDICDDLGIKCLNIKGFLREQEPS